jgi:hypothetical protein
MMAVRWRYVYVIAAAAQLSGFAAGIMYSARRAPEGQFVPQCFVGYADGRTSVVVDTGTSDGDDLCVERLLEWQEWHGGPPLDPACAARVVKECGGWDK